MFGDLTIGPINSPRNAAVEREPLDPEWAGLCKTPGVILTWPGDFTSALPSGQQKNDE